MTVQNEPLAVQTWGSCGYTAEKENKELEITVAQNPDGSNVLVMMNSTVEKKMVHLRVEGKCTRLIVPGNSISTVVLQ